MRPWGCWSPSPRRVAEGVTRDCAGKTYFTLLRVGRIEEVALKSLMLVSNDVFNDTRVQSEGRSLVEAGDHVTVVGWDRENTHPAGKLTVDGIEVRLVRSTPLMQVAPSMLIKTPLWWRSAFRLASDVRSDVVHSHDLDTLRAGVRLKERHGVPLLFDAHEIFSYMLEGEYPEVVVNYAERMERRLLRDVDHVVTVNERLRAYYEARTDKPVTVVMNCRDVAREDYTPPRNELFTVLFIGSLYRRYFILELIDVVQEVEGVRLVIGGYKELEDEVRARCARSPRTTFLGRIPSQEVMPKTLAADAIFCMADPSNRNTQVALPNKIFEAMAAGRPSIATRGILSGDIVERERCGLAVPYTKTDLREAIRSLADDPALRERLGRNGLAAVKREYNWKVQSKRLIAAVHSLAG